MNIRRRSLTDSLQLLVDTICNLFGSIVIISLLIALLSKDTSVDVAGADRTANLQRQVHQTQTELDEAERLSASLTNIDSNSAERLALAAQRDQLVKNLAAEQAAASSNTVRKSTEPVEAVNETEKLLKRKDQLVSEAETLAQQLARNRQAHQQQLRLPRERATGKKTYYFICRFGKIYPVHIVRGGERELNNQTLEWRETADGQTATPRRELGLDPAAGLQNFTRLFNEIPAQTYSIHFLVYNDSFPAFLTARQVPLARNFDTGWEFLTDDRQVIFSSQGEAPPAL